MQNLHSDLSILKSEMLHLRKDMNKILELLMEHPTHAISLRVKILENDVIQLQESLEESREQAGQLKLALFSSFLAVLGSVSVVVFEFFLKR